MIVHLFYHHSWKIVLLFHVLNFFLIWDVYRRDLIGFSDTTIYDWVASDMSPSEYADAWSDARDQTGRYVPPRFRNLQKIDVKKGSGESERIKKGGDLIKEYVHHRDRHAGRSLRVPLPPRSPLLTTERTSFDTSIDRSLFLLFENTGNTDLLDSPANVQAICELEGLLTKQYRKYKDYCPLGPPNFIYSEFYRNVDILANDLFIVDIYFGEYLRLWHNRTVSSASSMSLATLTTSIAPSLMTASQQEYYKWKLQKFVEVDRPKRIQQIITDVIENCENEWTEFSLGKSETFGIRASPPPDRGTGNRQRDTKCIELMQSKMDEQMLEWYFYDRVIDTIPKAGVDSDETDIKAISDPFYLEWHEIGDAEMSSGISWYHRIDTDREIKGVFSNPTRHATRKDDILRRRTAAQEDPTTLGFIPYDDEKNFFRNRQSLLGTNGTALDSPGKRFRFVAPLLRVLFQEPARKNSMSVGLVFSSTDSAQMTTTTVPKELYVDLRIPFLRFLRHSKKSLLLGQGYMHLQDRLGPLLRGGDGVENTNIDVAYTERLKWNDPDDTLSNSIVEHVAASPAAAINSVTKRTDFITYDFLDDRQKDQLERSELRGGQFDESLYLGRMYSINDHRGNDTYGLNHISACRTSSKALSAVYYGNNHDYSCPLLSRETVNVTNQMILDASSYRRRILEEEYAKERRFKKFSRYAGNSVTRDGSSVIRATNASAQVATPQFLTSAMDYFFFLQHGYDIQAGSISTSVSRSNIYLGKNLAYPSDCGEILALKQVALLVDVDGTVPANTEDSDDWGRCSPGALTYDRNRRPAYKEDSHVYKLHWKFWVEFGLSLLDAVVNHGLTDGSNFYDFLSDIFPHWIFPSHSRYSRIKNGIATPRSGVGAILGGMGKSESKSDSNIRFRWWSRMMAEEEIDIMQRNDVITSFGSVIFVWLWLCIYCRSLFIGTMAMFHIVVSLGVSLWIYKVLLGIDYFMQLHGCALYLVLGIGADDVFVFAGVWYSTLQEDDHSGDRTDDQIGRRTGDLESISAKCMFQKVESENDNTFFLNTSTGARTQISRIKEHSSKLEKVKDDGFSNINQLDRSPTAKNDTTERGHPDKTGLQKALDESGKFPMVTPEEEAREVQRRLSVSLARTFRAVLNTSLTTGVAFFSTVLSPLTPIASFGIYAAICIVVNYIYTVVILPCLFVLQVRYGSCQKIMRALQRLRLEGLFTSPTKSRLTFSRDLKPRRYLVEDRPSTPTAIPRSDSTARGVVSSTENWPPVLKRKKTNSANVILSPLAEERPKNCKDATPDGHDGSVNGTLDKNDGSVNEKLGRNDGSVNGTRHRNDGSVNRTLDRYDGSVNGKLDNLPIGNTALPPGGASHGGFPNAATIEDSLDHMSPIQRCNHGEYRGEAGIPDNASNAIRSSGPHSTHTITSSTRADSTRTSRRTNSSYEKTSDRTSIHNTDRPSALRKRSIIVRNPLRRRAKSEKGETDNIMNALSKYTDAASTGKRSSRLLSKPKILGDGVASIWKSQYNSGKKPFTSTSENGFVAHAKKSSSFAFLSGIMKSKSFKATSDAFKARMRSFHNSVSGITDNSPILPDERIGAPKTGRQSTVSGSSSRPSTSTRRSTVYEQYDLVIGELQKNTKCTACGCVPATSCDCPRKSIFIQYYEFLTRFQYEISIRQWSCSCRRVDAGDDPFVERNSKVRSGTFASSGSTRNVVLKPSDACCGNSSPGCIKKVSDSIPGTGRSSSKKRSAKVGICHEPDLLSNSPCLLVGDASRAPSTLNNAKYHNNFVAEPKAENENETEAIPTGFLRFPKKKTPSDDSGSTSGTLMESSPYCGAGDTSHCGTPQFTLQSIGLVQASTPGKSSRGETGSSSCSKTESSCRVENVDELHQESCAEATKTNGESEGKEGQCDADFRNYTDNGLLYRKRLFLFPLVFVIALFSFSAYSLSEAFQLSSPTRIEHLILPPTHMFAQVEDAMRYDFAVEDYRTEYLTVDFVWGVETVERPADFSRWKPRIGNRGKAVFYEAYEPSAIPSAMLEEFSSGRNEFRIDTRDAFEFFLSTCDSLRKWTCDSSKFKGKVACEEDVNGVHLLYLQRSNKFDCFAEDILQIAIDDIVDKFQENTSDLNFISPIRRTLLAHESPKTDRERRTTTTADQSVTIHDHPNDVTMPVSEGNLNVLDMTLSERIKVARKLFFEDRSGSAVQHSAKLLYVMAAYSHIRNEKTVGYHRKAHQLPTTAAAIEAENTQQSSIQHPSWVSIQFMMSLKKSAPYSQKSVVYDICEAVMKQLNEQSHTFLPPGFQSSYQWQWTYSEVLIKNTLTQGLGICFPIAFVVLFISTRFNLVVSSLGVLSILCIVVNVMGFFKWAMEWTLSTLEVICSILVVGFSVDYVLHFGHIIGEKSEAEKNMKNEDKETENAEKACESNHTSSDNQGNKPTRSENNQISSSENMQKDVKHSKDNEGTFTKAQENSKERKADDGLENLVAVEDSIRWSKTSSDTFNVITKEGNHTSTRTKGNPIPSEPPQNSSSNNRGDTADPNNGASTGRDEINSINHSKQTLHVPSTKDTHPVYHALDQMGGTIFCSAITTGGAGAWMSFCQIYAMSKMSIMIVVTISFALLYSLVFFVCLLLLIDDIDYWRIDMTKIQNVAKRVFPKACSQRMSQTRSRNEHFISIYSSDRRRRPAAVDQKIKSTIPAPI